MNTTHRVLALAAVSAISITSGAQAALLLQHTFDGGTASLNGTALDTNNISASTWVAGASGSYVDQNGNIIATNAAAAWVGLNGAITMGSADDIFEVAMVADKLGLNFDFQGGFWGPAIPSVTGQHQWQSGTAFWRWQDNSVTAYAGAGLTGSISGSSALANNAGPTLLTLRLDLTDATLTNNSFSLYLGDSATGTLVGSATFSGDESFEELGFSARVLGGNSGAQVTSLALTQIPEPSSSTILLGLSAIAMTALGRRRKM